MKKLYIYNGDVYDSFVDAKNCGAVYSTVPLDGLRRRATEGEIADIRCIVSAVATCIDANSNIRVGVRFGDTFVELSDYVKV